jgi:Mg/Co/Ni transporter MgtE
VSVELIPFNKRLNKFYNAKAKYDQNQSEVMHIHSLPSKPELVTIRLLDVAGFVKELNSDYNTAVFRLLEDTQTSEIISSIAVYLPMFQLFSAIG